MLIVWLIYSSSSSSWSILIIYEWLYMLYVEHTIDIYIPWKYESNVSIDSACSYFGETWIITIKYVYTMHIISITHIYVYIYILYIERMYKYMCVAHSIFDGQITFVLWGRDWEQRQLSIYAWCPRVQYCCVVRRNVIKAIINHDILMVFTNHP
jgi:hypothetical protein